MLNITKNMINKVSLSLLLLTTLTTNINTANSAIFKSNPSELTVTKETSEMLSVFSEAYAKIKKNYVTKVTDKELVEAAIEGMLSSLDPHSSYLNEKDLTELTQSTKGEFGGLGIEVTMESGVIKVIAALEGNPAEKAGIKPGDLIVAIEGNPIFGMSMTEAVSKMRGEPKTTVKISVNRENEAELLEFAITREIIKVSPVRSENFDNIAYLRISTFGEKTTEQLHKELQKIKFSTKGKDLSGIILDLRNNPGGLLDQAVAVTESFIGKGEVLHTKGRNTDEIQHYIAKKHDITEGLPIVVLINNGSASASEIVAGALQDHNRAIVMGTKSFGKGSVQTIMPLQNGAMKITTSRYYTPKGRSIQAEGITPDIVVEQAKIEKFAKPKIHLNEAVLKKHLKGVDEKNTKYQELLQTSVNNKYEQDFQLARAIDVIKSWSIFNQLSKK
ncbi:S41 family peptidase [Rickettsiales endosymbiont of Stachyamoeba lipophora]|uniref:S41 family peptidase n=1 Tax=Rickettsiales endosymbiont of Stachyamoeba lipophora TaxID=2486578 RepID=UPI0013DE4B15|nr:S41 family peptidase [Rickettsiales endosymbiont of Stachyamoeba lipophora]